MNAPQDCASCNGMANRNRSEVPWRGEAGAETQSLTLNDLTISQEVPGKMNSEETRNAYSDDAEAGAASAAGAIDNIYRVDVAARAVLNRSKGLVVSWGSDPRVRLVLRGGNSR